MTNVHEYPDPLHDIMVTYAADDAMDASGYNDMYLDTGNHCSRCRSTYHFYPTTVAVPFNHFSSDILCINGQELGEGFMAHEALWSNFCVISRTSLLK